MRKRVVFLLMILPLLTGCAQGEGEAAEELALTVQKEYAQQEEWSAQAEVTADYGRRVYTFSLTAAGDGEETTLTLTAPETVAGMTARLSGDGSRLEYDGVWVETGALDEEGLTPASALPVLLESLKSGYFRECRWEGENLLRVDCGEADQERGSGREVILWLDRETHALTKGEIDWNGTGIIFCQFQNFT